MHPARAMARGWCMTRAVQAVFSWRPTGCLEKFLPRSPVRYRPAELCGRPVGHSVGRSVRLVGAAGRVRLPFGAPPAQATATGGRAPQAVQASSLAGGPAGCLGERCFPEDLASTPGGTPVFFGVLPAQASATGVEVTMGCPSLLRLVGRPTGRLGAPTPSKQAGPEPWLSGRAQLVHSLPKLRRQEWSAQQAAR